MFWRATSLAAAGLWAMAASAQVPPPKVVMPRESPKVRAETERTLRELVKHYRDEKSAVCSIPLTEVPVAKNTEPMPILRPREPVEAMPLIPLPAPPCKEEQR